MISRNISENLSFYRNSRFHKDFNAPFIEYRFFSRYESTIKDIAMMADSIFDNSPVSTLITRGVISGFSSLNKLSVVGVGHCYDLNEKTLLEILNFDERALGIVVGNKFNVCYELTLNTGLKFFGYLIAKYQDKIMFFQAIEGFDLRSYNNFDQSYQLGEQSIIRFSSISNFSRIDYLLFP